MQSHEVAPLQQQAMDVADEVMLQQEQSPAYSALHRAQLINSTFRVKHAGELDVVAHNSNMGANSRIRCVTYTAGCFIGGVVNDILYKTFSVKAGHIRCATHKDGTYYFFGSGVHRVFGFFLSVDSNDIPLTQPVIQHGNLSIVTVQQGFVGLADDRGQPILLPPGMHQWRSDTMRHVSFIDLASSVIKIGPFTLLTVDEGYSAVTQDNGCQKVLDGGHTHMLTHRNWKFEKFISLKIHTDDLQQIKATTADNVVLETTATVNWRVSDANLAARNAAETMRGDMEGVPVQRAQYNAQSEVPKLRQDVLKQATASLAMAIGCIRYAENIHISALAASSESNTPSRKNEPEPENSGLAQLFGSGQITSAVKHANEICMQYGVSIISINVISAYPVDERLTEAFSAGAVAAAAAEQAETAARGNAKAQLITAQAAAESLAIKARADADAERVRAEGSADAAKSLESSTVAVELSKMRAAGELLGNKSSFFFADGATKIPALLGNPCGIAPN